MSVRGFQQALCDLIASPELCLRVRDGDGEALVRYELTDRDVRRLRTISQQPGMSVSCTLYRVNRITPLYSMLPRTCILLADGLVDEATAFWASQGTDMQFAPEVERFADYLRARVDAGAVKSPYLAEVLDFELAVIALRFTPRRRVMTELGRRRSSDMWEPSPLHRVVSFEHDPGALLGALAQGVVPEPELERGEFYLAIEGTDPELALQPIDVSYGRAFEWIARNSPTQADNCVQLQALIDARLVVPAS